MSPFSTQPARAPALNCRELCSGNEAVQTELTLPGLHAWVHSRPYLGASCGGDVYYLSTCGAGEISHIVLADVSGHGEGASRGANRLRKLMHKHIREPDYSKVARSLNEKFLAASKGRRFATALLATYFVSSRTLCVCNLGHPPAMWFHAVTSQWTWLNQYERDLQRWRGNLPLGVIREPEPYHFTVHLEPGDIVVLYTDALYEAMSPGSRDDRHELGADGLLQQMHHLAIGSASELGHDILAAVSSYRGGRPADDDETVIVLHHDVSGVVGADQDLRTSG